MTFHLPKSKQNRIHDSHATRSYARESQICSLSVFAVTILEEVIMDAKTTINETQVSALVDTGATDSFIQQVTLTKLGLGDLFRTSSHKVVFNNGQTETVRGRVSLSVQSVERKRG